MRVVIFLALLGFAAAAYKTPQRIVGGSPTTVETYPYMSNMQYHLWGFFWLQWCGGSLINSRSVLSAAHCFVGDRPSQWRVILGTSQASGGGGSEYLVENLILHAQYSDWTLDNDIAVIRLASTVAFSDTIAAASIPGPNYNLADNTVLTTIGWGALATGGSSPEQLQHVDINLINLDICKERYAQLKSQPGFQAWPDVTDNMICAGILDVGGKDACQGDSGGPLAHRANPADVIVGVVSWGYQCAHATYPGVNARVSRYTDWIQANA